MKSSYQYSLGAFVLAGVFLAAIYISQQDSSSPKSQAIVWKSFDEGVSLARTSNKKVLVDVYTDWCSWCKKMDSEVYTDADVIKLMDANFVAVKLNAESSKPVTFRGNSLTEAAFARELGVTGYPTILFFDPNANPITDLPGYSPAQRFALILKYIAEDHYKSTSFQEYLQHQSPQPKNDD